MLHQEPAAVVGVYIPYWGSVRRSAERLARGQVGTIVEEVDDRTLLVEFSDDQGRAHAVAPCPRAELRVLHYVPEAA
jgi:hypothetical protein